MLARINQDNLEKYFGMITDFCGNNDHPDPSVFFLIFRLMSIYSLVKQGSNVRGEELFDALLKEYNSTLINDNLSRLKSVQNRVIDISTNKHEFCNILEITDKDDKNLLEFLAGFVGSKAVGLKRREACIFFFSIIK